MRGIKTNSAINSLEFLQEQPNNSTNMSTVFVIIEFLLFGVVRKIQFILIHVTIVLSDDKKYHHFITACINRSINIPKTYPYIYNAVL